MTFDVSLDSEFDTVELVAPGKVERVIATGYDAASQIDNPASPRLTISSNLTLGCEVDAI